MAASRVITQSRHAPICTCVIRSYRSECVCVYNYSRRRASGPGRETFHAKVILRDDTDAYVGSVNLTRASLEYSMEVGLAVTGKAVRRIALVTDAVIAVAEWIV